MPITKGFLSNKKIFTIYEVHIMNFHLRVNSIHSRILVHFLPIYGCHMNVRMERKQLKSSLFAKRNERKKPVLYVYLTFRFISRCVWNGPFRWNVSSHCSLPTRNSSKFACHKREYTLHTTMFCMQEALFYSGLTGWKTLKLFGKHKNLLKSKRKICEVCAEENKTISKVDARKSRGKVIVGKTAKPRINTSFLLTFLWRQRQRRHNENDCFERRKIYVCAVRHKTV